MRRIALAGTSKNPLPPPPIPALVDAHVYLCLPNCGIDVAASISPPRLHRELQPAAAEQRSLCHALTDLCNFRFPAPVKTTAGPLD